MWRGREKEISSTKNSENTALPVYYTAGIEVNGGGQSGHRRRSLTFDDGSRDPITDHLARIPSSPTKSFSTAARKTEHRKGGISSLKCSLKVLAWMSGGTTSEEHFGHINQFFMVSPNEG